MKELRILPVLCLFCQVVCLPSSSADENVPAWRFTQDGDACGLHRILIAKSGMRSENLKAGLAVTARAPQWDVVVSNLKSRTYCVVPFSKFKGEMSSKLFDSDRIELKNADWKLDGSNTYSGHALNRYKIIVDPHAKASEPNGPFIGKATYWTFKSISAPRQIQQLLSKIFLLPPQVDGIPFKLVFGEANKGWIESLNTHSVEKTDVSALSFAVPKGYVLKKTQEEVMVDPVSRDVFDSFTKWSEPKLDDKKK